MSTKKYIRRPAVYEAIQYTAENIPQVELFISDEIPAEVEVGSYFVKDEMGNLSTMTESEFKDAFSEVDACTKCELSAGPPNRQKYITACSNFEEE